MAVYDTSTGIDLSHEIVTRLAQLQNLLPRDNKLIPNFQTYKISERL